MAKQRRIDALTGWATKYPLAPRYPRSTRLALRAADGTALRAYRISGPPSAWVTVVIAHGFVNSSRTPAIHAFVQRLSLDVHVIALDLRGHGASGGYASMGVREPLDVEAAVRAARSWSPGLPVVTLGISLGGAAVLLQAGTAPDSQISYAEAGDLTSASAHKRLAGKPDGVVAVSAPAFWGVLDTPGTARMAFWVGSRLGRFLLAHLLSTRLPESCDSVPDSSDTVAAIAPSFIVVAHDPGDWYFPAEHPERLIAWAHEPKALWWYEGRGHGTDLLDDAFADRVLSHARSQLGSEL